MSSKYEIGTRLRGHAKKFIKENAYSISEEFNVHETTKGKFVPHITFLRPFCTYNEDELIKRFEDYCSFFREPILFKISGFGIFENREKVIYAKINNDYKLDYFVEGLESKLNNLIVFEDEKIKLPEEPKIIFHVKIADKDINSCYKEVFKTLNNDFCIEQALLRVYLLRRNESQTKLILREYDFYLNKPLTRDQAKNPSIFNETIERFKSKTKLIPSPEGFVKIE